jgi:hypothetical protein
LAKVGTAVKVLQDAFQGVDPGSDAGQAILTAIKSLSKVAPVAKAAPGIGNEALRNISTQARQQAPLEMLLRQQAAGGGQPGGAGPPA